MERARLRRAFTASASRVKGLADRLTVDHLPTWYTAGDGARMNTHTNTRCIVAMLLNVSALARSQKRHARYLTRHPPWLRDLPSPC